MDHGCIRTSNLSFQQPPKSLHYVNHMLSVIDLLLDACPALSQYIINNPSKYYCIIVLLCLIINFVGLV